MLIIFDLVRNAILLIGGEESGRWSESYREAIPMAEARQNQYIKEQLDRQCPRHGKHARVRGRIVRYPRVPGPGQPVPHAGRWRHRPGAVPLQDAK